jgi:DNA (cytosine-5)-methyltransferase 1
LATDQIPVIDIFAGPGGLGEGFAGFKDDDGEHRFKIKLSIEKDRWAYQTLRLRAFFRQFIDNGQNVPDEYYAHLRDPSEETFNLLESQYPTEFAEADKEAWHKTLGEDTDELDNRIELALGSANPRSPWVLVGGPPCQAYSLIGRACNGGISPNDPRVRLYFHYRDIVATHKPDIFVMENVKGLLSAKVDGDLVFDQICKDLRAPDSNDPNLEYQLHSFVEPDSRQKSLFSDDITGADCVIKMEEYGIPQKRHRVIILGIRKTTKHLVKPSKIQKKKDPVSIEAVIDDLPRLRSGLSPQREDSRAEWLERLKGSLKGDWVTDLESQDDDLHRKISEVLIGLSGPQKDRGAIFVPANKLKTFGHKLEKDWFVDPKLRGYCNHETRGHIFKDLQRYLFASCFAASKIQSPRITDFPKQLLPKHKSATTANADGHISFTDRFKVQLRNKPASTVMSHISKDGHYYIHYDPSQCRSLTVREAARIQTFPDNYFFCGPRTEQYRQVGNAVPPLLGRQLATVVLDALNQKKVMINT